MTNIEIKARVKDLDSLMDLMQALSDRPCRKLMQEDIFFVVGRGRLKLRIQGENHGELIYYERNNSSQARPSNYHIYATYQPRALQALLEASLGVRGRVRKQRLLYIVGATRIHLDNVDGLGSFVEIETVLEPSQSSEQGLAMVRFIQERLGIEEADLVGLAYIDLIEAAQADL